MTVVTVEFVVEPGRAEAFREAVLKQAADSLTGEPGCRQFDVCIDNADPSRVFLYEVYDDDPAFDRHLATAHFKAFDEKVRPWLKSKTVQRWRRVDHG